MLTRLQKTTVWLLTVLPPVVITIAGVMHAIHQSQTFLTDARWIVGETISDYLSRPVRVGRARLVDIGTVVIDRLQIADGPAFSSGKMVTVHKVIVRYNPRALFIGGARAGAVESVEVIKPNVRVVRLPNGRFNISELIRPRLAPPGPPFKGTVRVSGGKLTYIDYFRLGRRFPSLLRIDNLNGVMSAESPHILALNLSALGRYGSFDHVRLLSKFYRKTSVLESDVIVSNANLPLFLRLFTGSSVPAGLSSGRITGALGIRTKLPLSGTVPEITGLVRFSNLELAAPGASRTVINVSGAAVLASNQAEVKGIGTFAGTRFGFQAIVCDYQDPKVQLALSSARADLSRIIQALGISPEVNVSSLQALVRAAGLARTSRTKGLPQTWKPHMSASNLFLSATYHRGKSVIDSFRFSLYGAPVVGNARVSTSGSLNFQIRGGVRNLRIDSLDPSHAIATAGTLDTDFDISRSAMSTRVVAKTRGRRALILGAFIDAFAANIDADVRNRTVAVSAAMNIYGGLVRIRGVTTPRKIDMAYSVEGLNTAELARTFGRGDISGSAYLVGRAFGKRTSPVLVGTAEVFDGAYSDYLTDYARATFSTDLNRLTVSDAVVGLFPAELRFSAHAVGLRSERADISGKAHVKRLEAEKLLEMLDRCADVKGTLSGDFAFSSTVALNTPPRRKDTRAVNISADGSVRLDDGSAFGFPISSGYARLAIADNKLRISDLNVVSEEARLSLSGDLDFTTRQVSADLSVTGFEMARLRQKLAGYAVMGGVADLSGVVTGQLDSPNIAVKANVNQFTLNGVTFDAALLEALYQFGGQVSAQLNLGRDKQTFQLLAEDVDLKTASAHSIVGKFSDLFVPDLRTMVVSSPYFASEKGEKLRNLVRRLSPFTDGRLSGRFEIGGFLQPPLENDSTKVNFLDHIKGSAYVHGANITFDSSGIESFLIDVSVSEGALGINKAVAFAGDTFASINPLTPGAPAYKDGMLALEAVVSNLRLGGLRPWLDDNTPEGLATVELTIQGNTGSPDIRGSVEIVEPQYGAFKFNSLRISQMRVTEDRVAMDEVLVSKDGHQAVAECYLPWDWGSFSVPADKPFEIALQLKNGDLSILHTLTPFVQATPATTGLLQAELKVEGTLSNYKITGSARASDGRIALRNFTNTFTNVSANIAFDEKNITFNELSAQSSSGGTVFAKPGSSINLSSRDKGYGQINVELKSLGLVIEEKGGLGLDESVRAQIDGALSIRGTLLEPLIANASLSGFPEGVTISNALISFAIPEKKRISSFSLPFRAMLDSVRLNLGERVRVRPPQMDLFVVGGGTIAGILNDKISAGFDIMVQQGTMRLATSRLRISPGARMTIRLQPPAEPEISVMGFEATTSVAVAGALGKRERYTVTILANGPVTNLNIALKSRPEGLSREQILAALGHVEGLLGSGSGDLQKELAGVLTAIGTTALLAPVERLFTEELGFEEFAIESGAYAPLSLYVTRRLFGVFDVSYYQRLRSSLANVQDTEWQARVGVKFRKFYSLSVSFDSQHTVSGEVTFNKVFGR